MSDLLIQLEHYVDTDPENPTAWARYVARVKTLSAEVNEGYWATVAVDTITSATITARHQSQYKTNPRGPAKLWFIDAAEQIEHQFYSRMSALTCNVVLAAHVDNHQDEAGTVVLYLPNAPGRNARGLPSNFETYRSYATRVGKEMKYQLQTANDGLHIASSNTMIAPPSPCDLSYEAIWANYREIENVDRPNQHLLLYGESGTRKSTLIAQFPKPLLVLVFDGYGKVGPYLAAGVPGPLDTSGPTPIRGVFAS